MKAASAALDIDIRPYADADEAGVLDLLTLSLGAGPARSRPPEFFRWKHVANPFGRSFLLVAETEGRIVGLRAFMRWRFTIDDRTVSAVRAVDTATHPEFRRAGLFSRMTLQALDALRGEVDLVFNTPNEKSLPGYLKMGWRTVGTIPVRVRVRHPVRFVRGIRSSSGESAGDLPDLDAAPVSVVLADDSLADLLEGAEGLDGALSTPRSLEYLRWRYGDAPLLDYRAIADERGLTIFRVRNRGRLREATIAELIVPPKAVGQASRLLRRVARAGGVDHLTASFPRRSTAARAAVRGAFLPSPKGITLVTNPLVERIEPDPIRLSSWGLTLGDLEVF